MTFQLPRSHIDRNSTTWQRRRCAYSTHVARQKGKKAKHYRRRLSRPLTPRLIRRGVLDGTKSSVVSNIGATSSAGLACDAAQFDGTGRRSNKIVHVANGDAAHATEVRQLRYLLRAPARTFVMIPSLRGASLLSTSELADAGYVSVYDGKNIDVYDGRTAKILVSEAAVLQRWCCPDSKPWRTPPTADVQHDNTDTFLLDTLDGHSSLNALYHVSHIAKMRDHIEAMRVWPSTGKAINHVYKLPSVEPAIRYLRAPAR